MKIITVCLLSVIFTLHIQAQYYYKDLVVTRQTAAQWQIYRDARVKSIKLLSSDGSGQASEGFDGSQEISPDGARIKTHTHTTGTPDAWILATYSPAGQLLKIVDTSDTYRSISEYQYDDQGRIASIINTSTETDNHAKDIELHRWSYTPAGKPSGMLKIRNGADTTRTAFITDEKGNIVEERPTHNGSALPVVYYYYDDQGRMTDIVRYNARAARLLPDYVFEYEAAGSRLASMLVVPEGTKDYQKWIYSYDDKGLKTGESCLNRQKQLVGKIEYQYTYK